MLKLLHCSGALYVPQIRQGSFLLKNYEKSSFYDKNVFGNPVTSTLTKEATLNLENLILTFGYLAIFIFMVTNGIISLPSSQFIYVTAGFLVPSGKMEFLPIVIIGTIGNMIGNAILYEVSRRKGLKHITRWKGFSEEKIIRLHRAFRRRGSVIIFIGKFLPGVKVFVPVVAGIACMNRVLYTTIIVVTSFLWALGLTYFGVYFGKNYGEGTFGWYSLALIILAVIAIYAFHKYVQSISIEDVIEDE